VRPASLLIASLLAFPCVALAQTAPPPAAAGGNGTPAPLSAARAAVAARPTAPPTLDGRLDEPTWQAAGVLSGFVQRVPFDGQPASEPTEVRVLSDESAIYVGVWLFDSDPSRIVDGESIRDANMDESDAVLLILDTFRDRRNGFVFGTNPSGIEYDGQVVNEGEGGGGGGAGPGGGGAGGPRQQGGAGGGFNRNWDGSWEVATSRDERGWYAEFRIPFSTLRYGDAQEWGLNVERRIRRHNEESLWSPVARQFSLYRVSSAGALQGLTPPTRRHATVTPYVLGSTNRDWAAGDLDFRETGELGMDAKVQVTGGLTLDLTYNTDFAQVEVDEAQLNLTRFNIRFPEKRPFFLENSGLFTLGVGQAELFFSRSIGIVSGTQVPILGGGRLSGRAVGLNIGLLHIQTDDAVRCTAGALECTPLAPRQAYSVARIARELPSRSRLGAIFVNKDASGPDNENQTYGVDGQLGIGETVTFNSFAGWTETPGLEGKNHVYSASGVYAGRDLRLNGNFREVGDAFNPEVGFVPRKNYRYYQGMWQTFHRPSRIFRELRPHMSYETYRNLETGFEESARVHVDSHFEFPDGAFISPAFDYVTEGLDEPFPIAEGVVVPAGTYKGWTAAWRFNTNQSAALSFDGGIDWGSLLSGDRKGGFGGLTYRMGDAFSSSFRYTYNDVQLPEGEFQTNLVTWRAGYFFTPRIYVQSLIQYSDQSDNWGANLRFGWLNTAGTGLFIVFNEARCVRGNEPLWTPTAACAVALERETPLNRGVIIKFNRQFNAWQG
jgi:hypothetical protein